MNILRRLLFMLISIFFILSNLLFYTINFKEYVNFRIFQKRFYVIKQFRKEGNSEKGKIYYRA